jgi:fructose-bisphosphate aldolase class II
MALMNPRPWLLEAQRERFAVGAFNANTLEQAQAIAWAAQEERAPVILQVSHRALEFIGNGNPTLGLRYMARLCVLAAESVSVPVSVHLDHGTEEEVLQAMALGYSSVMFDGNNLPFEDNARTTRRLCEKAHALGISIEAELGEVPRVDLAGRTASVEMTDPDQAATFVSCTGVDALAVAIGSVHGVKHKHVTLDLKRLCAIRACVDVPLVLHGSSGVTDDCIAEGIALGLCKINVATQLNQALTRVVRDQLGDEPTEVDPRRYLKPAREAVMTQVRERIRRFGSAGKA